MIFPTLHVCFDFAHLLVHVTAEGFTAESLRRKCAGNGSDGMHYRAGVLIVGRQVVTSKSREYSE